MPLDVDPMPNGNVQFQVMGGFSITFHGVRGSTPCCSADRCTYGGNTSCVVLEAEGHEPIIFDMGTGLREYGYTWDPDIDFAGSLLLTHLHWDHVQGLPFFKPGIRPGGRLNIFGPPETDESLGDCFYRLMSPPFFPVCCGDLASEITFHDVQTDSFTLGDAKVLSRPVPHTGATNGYRVDLNGYSVAYISDHQQPLDDPTKVDEGVLELIDGVDLLIHDAQYTDEQFAARADWGHCTMDYAAEVARQGDVGCLALFHHDPENTDDILPALVENTQRRASKIGVQDVVAAIEGQKIQLG